MLTILSQAQATLGGRSANPTTFVANLTIPSEPWGAVNPLLDGSPGRIKQALGQLGVNLFIHGHSPWWNPYTGLGSPLASDLQSAVFYPFSLIVYGLHWAGTGPDLVALLDVFVAGLTAYWLARELGIARRGALVTGTAFCLIGSFAWFGTLMGDVMAWTPASLAFTVRLLRPTTKSRTLDFLGLGLVTALQMLGGFPESLALQILLLTLPLTVAGVIRLSQGRLVAFLRVAGGISFGFLVTAFFWIPFVTLLPDETVWNFSGQASVHLPLWANLVLFVPFGFGHWFDTSSLTISDWYQVGGYVGVVAGWLAVVGILGGLGKRRHIALPFAVSVLLAGLCITGVPPMNWIAHLPVFSRIPFGRLSVASLEMAVAVLAGLAVTLQLTWKSWFSATALYALILSALIRAAPHGVARHQLLFALVCLAVVALGIPAFQAAGRWVRHDPTSRLLGLAASGLALAVVAVELLTLANLDYRNLPALRQVSTISKPPAWIGYVRTHLHGGRLFASNNLLIPNYSGDFGIRELSFQDAVEPRNAMWFVQDNIDPKNTNPHAFEGNALQLTSQSLKELELAGITLLALPDPGCQGICGHLPLRYLDRQAKVGVFAVPEPQPQLWFPRQLQPGQAVPADLFHAASVAASIQQAPGVTASAKPLTTTTNLLKMRVHTGQRRLLVIRQVEFAGWHASINGRQVPILTVDGVFQGLEVPAGTSTVTVSYTPPGLHAAELVSLLAAVAGAAAAIWAIRRQRRRPNGVASAPGPVE